MSEGELNRALWAIVESHQGLRDEVSHLVRGIEGLVEETREMRDTLATEARETRSALRDLAAEQRVLTGEIRALVGRIDALIERRDNGAEGRA